MFIEKLLRDLLYGRRTLDGKIHDETKALIADFVTENECLVDSILSVESCDIAADPKTVCLTIRMGNSDDVANVYITRDVARELALLLWDPPKG